MESKQSFSGYVENVTWLLCQKGCLQNSQSNWFIPITICKTRWVEDGNVAAGGIAIWSTWLNLRNIISLYHNRKDQKIANPMTY